MRFVTHLPLLGRNPSIRPSPVPLTATLSITRNASRLSGIHAGLRRSERARPQGASPKKEIRQAPGEEPYLSPEERRKARQLARRNPPTFKIRKGKKNITEQPGPPRISRAARLADPRDPLGKHSLLKKFKTGQLLKELRESDEDGKHGYFQHDDFARQMVVEEVEHLMNSRKVPHSKKSRKRLWESVPEAGRRAAREERAEIFGRIERDKREPHREAKFDRFHGSRRDVGPSHDGGRVHQDRRERSATRGGPRFDRSDRAGLDREYPRAEHRPERSSRDRRDAPALEDSRGQSSRSERQYDETLDDDTEDVSNAKDIVEISDKKRKKYEPPTSVIYTTAASQFLYGTSTVEAALHATRRQLYTFYIYQGTNRRNHQKDEYLTELAWKRGVKVEFLEESGLPMLNKMSDNRPHNGYVLEASPLPQLPVTALGEVSANQSLPGFNVSIGHQSTEEARVNGTADFIITEPSVHKPFVLLLDQVLDPGNLGAILRTASFMGVTAVAVAKRGTSPVTPVVLKASAGAAETLTMFSVDSVVDFVKDSKENGWKVYTAVPPKKESGRGQADLRTVENSDPLLKNPCILVLGSEGEGLSRQLRRAADFEVSIPNMSGSKIVDSLNVSVAAGLLCSAFVKGKMLAASSGVQDAGALF